MANYITLNELKAHLRVEYTDEDTYLTSLIGVAECAVSNEIERDLSECVDGGVLPAALKHAIMVLCGDLYNNRESVAFSTPSEVPLSFKYLLAPYKKYNQGCSGDVVAPTETVTEEPTEDEPTQDTPSQPGCGPGFDGLEHHIPETNGGEE